MKRMILLLLALLLLLSGCQSSENSNEQEEENNSQQEEVIEEESSAVSEIKEAGSYTYTANDSISSITVNTDGEVELIFNNFTLESDSAAIIVKKADKLTITLIGNNSLSGGDKSCPAVIYSAADIEITGSGSLSLEGKKYGIYSDKDITVDASITISTGDHGLHGDVITVRGGSLVVTSENDAIHAFDVTISTDGSITLSAEDDAIHADEDIYINGGKIRIQGHEGLKLPISKSMTVPSTSNPMMTVLMSPTKALSTSTVAASSLSRKVTAWIPTEPSTSTAGKSIFSPQTMQKADRSTTIRKPTLTAELCWR